MLKFKFLNNEISSIHAAAFLLGAAGLLSRLLGVLRDRLLASTYGAGRELDIYYAAFQIPDLMSVLFLLGAASAAIIPVFQEYARRDRDEAHRLISELASVFFVGILLVSGALYFAAPLLMRLVAPGFSSAERELSIMLTRIMLISPVFLGLSSILSSVVQTFQRFWAYALAPIFYNAGIIFGILFFIPLFGIAGLGFGVILGAFLHFFTQFMTARALGFSPYPANPFIKKMIFSPAAFTRSSFGIRRVSRLSFPRALSLSLTHLTLLALIAIGSTLKEGSIAIFQLAQNLYFLPVGVFGVSYAVAIFPRMSRAYVERNAARFYQELIVGMRTILFWIIPSTVLFVVLRAHIVRVALGAGEFSWVDTRLTAASLALFAVSLFAGALITLLIRGFYALENTWTPLLINLGASILSVGAAYFGAILLAGEHPIVFSFKSALKIAELGETRVLALVLGFSLGAIVNALALYAMLARFANVVFRERLRFPAEAIIKITAASLLGGAAAYGARVSFSETLPLVTFSKVLLQGAIAGVAFAVVYFGALFLFKSDDVYSLWKSIRLRLLHFGVLPRVWGEGGDPH